MTPYTIADILAAFSYALGAYPRAHVNAALSMRAEITPHLIEVLDAMWADPDRFISDESYTGHFFAAMLLGYWGETAAHKVLIDLALLPEHRIDVLFGEFIVEDLPAEKLPRCDAGMGDVHPPACPRPVASPCPAQTRSRQTKPAATAPPAARGEEGEETQTLVSVSPSECRN
jgi:hypothetical protein